MKEEEIEDDSLENSEEEENEETPKKQSSSRTSLWFLVIAIALVFIILPCACMSKGSIGLRSEADAYSMAKEFIKGYLETPATAQFPLIDDYGIAVVKVDNDTWKVIGWFDAQNIFGALIRNYYECSVSYVGEGKWILESLNINGDVLK